MNWHKITNEEDVEKLQDIYEDDALFFDVYNDNGEEFTLADMRYNMDWNNFDEITIQHI